MQIIDYDTFCRLTETTNFDDTIISGVPDVWDMFAIELVILVS